MRWENPWCFAPFLCCNMLEWLLGLACVRPRPPRSKHFRSQSFVSSFSRAMAHSAAVWLAIEGAHAFPTVAQVSEKRPADHKAVPLVSIALGVHIRALIVC